MEKIREREREGKQALGRNAKKDTPKKRRIQTAKKKHAYARGKRNSETRKTCKKREKGAHHRKKQQKT